MQSLQFHLDPFYLLIQYVINEQGFAKVPGMQEYGIEVLDIDILDCISFPWQLRIVSTRFTND